MGIQGENVVAKALQAVLPFFDDYRLKRAGSITRDRQIHGALRNLNGFGTRPIAGIAFISLWANMAHIAQMCRY